MPTISKTDIQFSNKLIGEIDRIVTLNDFSPPNFSKDLNKFFDAEGKVFNEDYIPIYKRKSNLITNNKSWS